MKLSQWTIDPKNSFVSAELVESQRRASKMLRDEHIKMIQEAESAVLDLKPVEDMTDREKMGLLFAGRCEIDFSGGTWKTRHPCGILLHGGVYRIYEDVAPRGGTTVTVFSRDRPLTQPPESAS